MRKHLWILSLLLSVFSITLSAQVKKIDSSVFFKDDRIINITLSTDFRKLIADKMKMVPQPASITFHLPDSTVITEDITINARGITRKESCKMPPLMLNFRNGTSPRLSSLHKLKLVNACGNSEDDNKLGLKEFLAYRIYNLLTDMSLKVRLLHITYEDTKGKMKSYSQDGFLIEDVGAMAKRNKCREVQKDAFNTESTQRDQMTLVALFEYMIGNTDWSVPNYHNIKLIRPKNDPNGIPYVVPYDYDYCGLVNAYYAVPSEEIVDIKSVTERAYRGYGRTMEELQQTIKLFNDQKNNIKNLIMNFEPLAPKARKEAMDYIEDFYKIINDSHQVEMEFIKGARK